ncbi:hypothetical protein PLESTB_000342500 [Pleodorina starrii]|uniref:Uncharacterized protein n=1 Tax=Pleodorina starrii TaxID=330485 RepID=A0A9W6BDJ6_9CHLO|nr:hypothetical protein PLESTM_000052100 [Pleodorina starrii]GLC50104.1 hypothetical protein PLESTB_000342500 [Pleodorina starrii]GLC73116.1 hypothetical protein PLESTF_001333900 [Pleodorina starrii]
MQPPPLSLWQEFLFSRTISPGMYRVRSGCFLAASLVVAFSAFCVIWSLSVPIVAAARKGGYTGPKKALEILDARFGYSMEDVNQVLSAWTTLGRAWYLGIEFLDVALFIPAYSAADLVLMNCLISKLQLWRPDLPQVVRQGLVCLPFLVAAADNWEDVGQVALTLWFESAAVAAATGEAGLPPTGWWWGAAVAVSSCVNQIKWWCIRVNLLLIVLLVCLWVRGVLGA